MNLFIPGTYWGKWIAWLSALIYIVSLFICYFKNSSTASEWAICTAFIWFIVVVVLREIQLARKEKYANISNHKHRCLHLIRDLSTYLSILDSSTDMNFNHSKNQIRQAFTEILTEFSFIFSMITGTHCRAAIKTIIEKNNKLYIQSFARDSHSKEENEKKDKERLENLTDSLEENTDFDLLYYDKLSPRHYFISNDLPTRRGYNTSSFKVWGSPPDNVSRIKAHKEWTLPYKSTIVWPIQQNSNEYFGFENQSCVGFLAIDSESVNVFYEKWDVHLGAVVSDSLYHLINQLISVTEKYEKKLSMGDNIYEVNNI